MRLDSVAIKKFSPFVTQQLKFPCKTENGERADTHIFVGENGTGKTRLLALLMAACGNRKELDDRGGAADAWVALESDGPNREVFFSSQNIVSRIAAHQLDLLFQQAISGKLPGPPGSSGPNFAHRHPKLVSMAFRSVASIREAAVTPMAPVALGNRADLLSFTLPPKDNESMCQAFANLKVRAGMYLAANPGGPVDRTIRMTQQLEGAIQRITGRPFVLALQQQGNQITMRVSWGDVRMSFHHLPDGLRAIIGWLARCVVWLDLLLPDAANPLEEPAILFLDEPETHLHPAWQRKILPALQSLLPNAQIFVATHSPFVISSVNSGWLYVLKADHGNEVRIAEPRPCSKGDTYIDAVEDVLGVKQWYDPETEVLLERFRGVRDKALSTSAAPEEEEMKDLARQIAQRSDSLSHMMGQELKQFADKRRLASK